MGYSYDFRGRLACDGCGATGKTRRRKCPHTVLGDSLRGPRFRLPYCPAPALCPECYAKHGPSKKLHEGCAEGARKSQAEADAIEAQLDAGVMFNTAAWGDWHETVPAGMVGVVFRGRAGEQWSLIPADRYHARRTTTAEVADVAQEWLDHPR